MLKALISTRLLALLSYLVRGSVKKKKHSLAMKIAIAALVIYVIGCLFMMFGFLFMEICIPFHEMGIDWFYFGMAAITAAGLMFIGSVFTTQTQLYEARDNDLLLSMPIPPRYILGSRMIILLVLNYFFQVLVVAPAGVIYCMYIPVNALGIVCFIAAFLVLPLLVLALSCLFGWIAALISSRVRNKSLITLVLSLAFLGAYFYFFSNMNTYIQKLIVNGDAIAGSIKGSALPVYWLGTAIAEQNILNLLLFVLCAVVPFVTVYATLSASFIRVATAKRGFAKIKYKEQALKVSSARAALLKKELKHFASSPMYMLNGAIGVVFILVAAAALIIRNDLINTLLKDIPELMPFIGPVAIGMLCLISCTNIISAPSISLEGKNLWISKSIPVDIGDVLLSKAMLHILVCLPPVLIAEIVAAFALKLTAGMTLLLLAIPALITIFCGLFGVAVNLKFPRFDWISETVAVKQGASSMIAMFGSAAVVILPALLYALVLADHLTATAFLTIYTVLAGIACLSLYRWLMTRGKAIFEAL